MENVSPEVSPIKSKLRIPLNNLLAFKKSPKWLRSSDSKPDFTPTLRSSKSEFPTLREIQNEEKESIPKTEKLTAQTRQISAETQDTNITWSNIESHLEKISRPPSTKNEQWEKSMNNVEPLSPFSRNMSEYQAQSYFSRPFSADVGTIPECEESCNLNLGEDSYENPLNEDLNHIGWPNAGFTFEDLRQPGSSEIQLNDKNQENCDENYLTDLNEEIEKHFHESKDELITVQDESPVLNNQPFNLDLVESRRNFDRLRDFSPSSRRDRESPSPVTIKTNVRSSLHNQLEFQSKEKWLNKETENGDTNSRRASVEKQPTKSLEDFPFILSSSKKNSNIKQTESRDELSDRVSKFYFQKQTGFANQNEAFELVRKNLYPNFLNDKKADAERILSRDNSASKSGSKIVTPSKTLTDLFERHGSLTKNSGNKSPSQSPIIQKKEEDKVEEEKEPMAEYWETMKRDQSRDVPKERKEDLIKYLFAQRAQAYSR